MAKLTTAARKAIPTSSFALPGRRYPIEDRSHAANALARVSQHGSSSEKATVRAKVHAKYPTMGESHTHSSHHGHHSGSVRHHHSGHPLHIGMKSHEK